MVLVSDRSVRRWVQEFETTESLAKSKMGKHSKVFSPILHSPDFKEEFIEHVREASRPNGRTIFPKLSTSSERGAGEGSVVQPNFLSK